LEQNAVGVATIWLLFYLILLVVVGASWSAGDKPVELLRSAIVTPGGPF
jgi:hypothetical protein